MVVQVVNLYLQHIAQGPLALTMAEAWSFRLQHIDQRQLVRIMAEALSSRLILGICLGQTGVAIQAEDVYIRRIP